MFRNHLTLPDLIHFIHSNPDADTGFIKGGGAGILELQNQWGKSPKYGNLRIRTKLNTTPLPPSQKTITMPQSRNVQSVWLYFCTNIQNRFQFFLIFCSSKEGMASHLNQPAPRHHLGLSVFITNSLLTNIFLGPNYKIGTHMPWRHFCLFCKTICHQFHFTTLNGQQFFIFPTWSPKSDRNVNFSTVRLQNSF